MSIRNGKISQEKNYKTLIRLLIFVLFIGMVLPFQTNNVKAVPPPPPNQVFLPIVMNNDTSNAVNCPDGPDQWLCLVNYYRNAAGLNPLSSNTTYSDNVALHTNYMLLNPTQDNVHIEYVGKPGYTIEGNIAAGQSNMISLIGATYLTTRQSIDLWMQTPSHRYKILHPDLTESGYNLKCNQVNCFSGLNILGSLPPSYLVSNTNVVYPGDRQIGIPANQYPITWGFFMPWTGNENDSDEVRYVSANIYNESNQKISYTKSEPNHTDGSWDYNNQVVLTPTSNLLPNHTYRVEMTVSFQGQNYSKTWSFTTGSTP